MRISKGLLKESLEDAYHAGVRRGVRVGVRKGKAVMQVEFDALLARIDRLKSLNGTTALLKAAWDESKHSRDHGKFSSSTRSSVEEQSPDEHAKTLVARIAEVPRAVRNRVSWFVKDRYEKLAARYGHNGARAVLGAAILLTPIPLPGTTLIPVALAEVVLKLRRAVAGVRMKALAEELTDEELRRLAVELVTDLYAEMGEEFGTDQSDVVVKAFQESDHPRDSHGQFVSKDELDAAKSDPAKAAELRERVTDPEERKKLEKHIGGVEKPKGKAKPKGPAPGSQLSEEQRQYVRKLGMTGAFPPHDVPLDAIKMPSEGATPEEMKYKAIMQWDQKTKSGRISRQYRYTQEFHDRNAAEKFDRVMKVEPYLEGAKNKLVAIMSDQSQSERIRDAAAIASIIAETGLRPTDGNDSVKHGHYGIASLLAKHASLIGDEIHLDFIGKGGKRNQTVVRDPANVAYLRSKLSSRDPGEHLWDASSSNAADTLKSAVVENGGPHDVKLKDLRTIKATVTARKVVADWDGPPPPLTGKKAKDAKSLASAILKMSGDVAKVLNNTATQARDNYIHPEVFEKWKKTLMNNLTA